MEVNSKEEGISGAGKHEKSGMWKADNKQASFIEMYIFEGVLWVIKAETVVDLVGEKHLCQDGMKPIAKQVKEIRNLVKRQDSTEL